MSFVGSGRFLVSFLFSGAREDKEKQTDEDQAGPCPRPHHHFQYLRPDQVNKVESGGGSGKKGKSKLGPARKGEIMLQVGIIMIGNKFLSPCLNLHG